MFPTLETIPAAALLQQGYTHLPVAKELYADFITPIEALRALKAHSLESFLLESMQDPNNRGRYSFLGFEPLAQVRSCKGEITLTTTEPALLSLAQNPSTKSGDSLTFTAHPNAFLREILRLYKSPKLRDMPPFTGGLVGYFAYEFIRYAESALDFPTPKPPLESSAWELDSSDDMHLMLFLHIVVFDHLRQKLLLITNVNLAQLESSYTQATHKLDSIAQILYRARSSRRVFAPFRLESSFSRYFTKEQFSQRVQAAKHYIKQGDIFQVVLSNPMQAKASGSLFDVYRVLRTSNPSPYMFYLSSDELEIAGASPETLVQLESGAITTYPLAGSRPRGANEQEDMQLELELLHDEKELSEHNMLVDLSRNDMGRVAQIGSVKVTHYKQIVKYSHIMHLSSSVVAKLDSRNDALDALGAILPAGTLSGAPKIRACEIIYELEDMLHSGGRGIYGGAIGYLDFTGNMDTCIAIRLVYKRDDRIFVRSGAGIVYESDENAEWQELDNKARAIIHALELASAGLDRGLDDTLA